MDSQEPSFITFLNFGFLVLSYFLWKTNWGDSPGATIPGGVREAMTLDACKRNERMNLGAFHAHNVVNLNPAHRERIRDERTVTTPWNCFRTHDRAPLLPGQFHQSV
jgi:hypothetical protein